MALGMGMPVSLQSIDLTTPVLRSTELLRRDRPR